VIQKEQTSQKRMETRALNICQFGPPPEYVKDSEEDKTSVQTREAEYEQRNQLFMTRILSKSTAEDLCAVFMTSQKLAKEAHCSAEA